MGEKVTNRFQYSSRRIASIWLLALSGMAFGQSGDVLDAAPFSSMAPGGSFPVEWRPLDFPKIPRHTQYSLVPDQDGVVVKAVADASASGLVREIKVDPKALPLVQWRWKVDNILEKSDVGRKEGDDYPARVYVSFEYDPGKLGFVDRAKYEALHLVYGHYPPLRVINYIWDSKAPKGTMVPNAYADRDMMIVVESGAAKVGQWVEERRNVYEDYKRAFGEDPGMITGVALMTDTDNTGESATAYYGDIRFKAAPERRGANP
jgi:hypothetical protein